MDHLVVCLLLLNFTGILWIPTLFSFSRHLYHLILSWAFVGSGCYLLPEGPMCGSSAGRWCSAATCCGGRPSCRLAAGPDAPASQQTRGQILQYSTSRYHSDFSGLIVTTIFLDGHSRHFQLWQLLKCVLFMSETIFEQQTPPSWIVVSQWSRLLDARWILNEWKWKGDR